MLSFLSFYSYQCIVHQNKKLVPIHISNCLPPGFSAQLQCEHLYVFHLTFIFPSLLLFPPTVISKKVVVFLPFFIGSARIDEFDGWMRFPFSVPATWSFYIWTCFEVQGSNVWNHLLVCFYSIFNPALSSIPGQTISINIRVHSQQPFIGFSLVWLGGCTNLGRRQFRSKINFCIMSLFYQMLPLFIGGKVFETWKAWPWLLSLPSLNNSY